MKKKKKSNERKVFIISGISGAGKSQALKCFEDFGFSCVDNLPVALLEQFADLLIRSHHRRVALGMDIREGKLLAGLPIVLKRLKGRGFDPRVLFLDASDSAVIQRFSETRHRHPLGLKLADAIKEERRRLLPIKEIADKVIDSTAMTLGELKEAISQTLELTRTREMTLSIVSFGYKYGIPMDADIVMDVRFLPNPHFVQKLRRFTGKDPKVRAYINSFPQTGEFLRRIQSLLAYLIPHYITEGKSYLTIAFGCTGGKHRSVMMSESLKKTLEKRGFATRVMHRDITK